MMEVSDVTCCHRAESEGAYRYTYSENESPSEAVVYAVADAAERPLSPPVEEGADVLPPLYRVIDPDALDSLFVVDEERLTDRSVTFRYCDHRVTVADDVVIVVPPA